MLTRNGEAVVNIALEKAIKAKDTATLEWLLLNGVGMFQNLPVEFWELDANASHCYVEGMSVDKVPVTREMRGFHQAFFSVAEIKACKLKIDRLDPTATTREIPFSGLLDTFNQIEDELDLLENPAFRKAIDEYREINQVTSLQKLTHSFLFSRRDNIEIHKDNVTMSLFDYLTQHHPALQSMIWREHPHHKPVIELLSERVAELTACEYHLAELKQYVDKKRRIHRFAASLGSWAAFISVPLYGVYGCTVGLLFCCGPRTAGPIAIPNAELMYFGVPGFIVLAAAVVGIALIINYTSRYGCGGDNPDFMLCGFNVGHPSLLRQDNDLGEMLDRLIDILKNENLPPDIRESISKLGEQGVTYDFTLTTLNTLTEYYLNDAIPRIKEDRSQTPLNNFNSTPFFWSEIQRQNRRENQLPPRVIMHDNNNDEFPAFTSMRL